MNGQGDRRLKGRPGPGSYEVGYARPPAATRFKPGQSGHPKGRPKGSKGRQPALHEERLKDIVLNEASREITVRDRDRNVTVPMTQAIVRAMAVNAAKGQHRAQRLFSEMLATVARQNKARYDDWMETAITQKIEWAQDRVGARAGAPRASWDHGSATAAAAPRSRQGRLREGTARIAGPATKEEKALYDWQIQRRADFEEELGELRRGLPKRPALRCGVSSKKRSSGQRRCSGSWRG